MKSAYQEMQNLTEKNISQPLTPEQIKAMTSDVCTFSNPLNLVVGLSDECATKVWLDLRREGNDPASYDDSQLSEPEQKLYDVLTERLRQRASIGIQLKMENPK